MGKKPSSFALFFNGLNKKKPSSFAFFFKRLNKKASGGGAWRWKSKSSAGFRWKKRFNLWLVDGLLFKIVSIFEAIVLVSRLCLFFLICGCQF